ncbi:Jag N-terminal domain-containing protein [Facklamia sp. DSM 111018]|uniref:RNA-binding protein KhpB n=1 Tax=Facklamia lactis TaxID=2749967 RepID=A0ABS0LST0_9LACT|nr:RNA-binding cell elongation regulator Jag/EloR [Facklamia lactis]MBG9981301.1 Jag N-terminal domain-containing protein [Facklamia lactis]MBG9987223.1 Jag N-terminal domain-containing protein [Facklamia lactis]
MLDRTLTVRAESVDKAIQQGLQQLNISEQDAEIRIISEGKKGFFGFGKQEAVVNITAKTELSMKEITQQLEKEAGISSDLPKAKKQSKTADYIRKNNEQEALESVSEVNEIEEVETFNQEADIKQSNEKNNLEIEEKKKQDDVQNSLDQKEATNLVNNIQNSTMEPVKNEVVSESELDQERNAICRYLENVIREYGAEAEVNYEMKGNQIIFNIETDKSGLVIGKHGKIINALQTLVQVMIHRRNRRRISVMLNVGDYRDRRLNVLEQMAQRTAEQVLKTKQTVILDPLPAYERKQIHAYLSKIEHISTHSEGKDPNRYLVVDYEA